jgi:hypothetical protein
MAQFANGDTGAKNPNHELVPQIVARVCPYFSTTMMSWYDRP